MENQQDKVKASFTAQASRFSHPSLTLSNQNYINWIIESLPLRADMTVLDVACGTGIMSRALARSVRSVTGIDVTPAMLAQARELAENEALHNVEFIEREAGKTGFPPQTFDLTTTRFSLHHFEIPIDQVQEMARITKNNGYIAIIDLVSPPDAHLATRYNEYERLRDPSHTIALSSEQLEKLIQDANLTIEHAAKIEVQVNVARWLALTKPEALTAERIVADLEAESQGTFPATGLFPSKDASGELVFRQQWMMIVGTKA
jgi:ubiquinone/menaquinone biosynthesis C-methylase UbiE